MGQNRAREDLLTLEIIVLVCSATSEKAEEAVCRAPQDCFFDTPRLLPVGGEDCLRDQKDVLCCAVLCGMIGYSVLYIVL